MIYVRKRRLREEKNDRAYWAKTSVEDRLKAVQVINGLDDPIYAKQAFPRFFKITRRKRG